MKQDSAWEEIENFYHQALDLPAGEREALLAGASARVRMEVESLLETDAGAACLAALPVHLAADFLDRQQSALRGGQRVGGYEIESLVSSGGMGEVYLAHDAAGVRVALKVLRQHLSASEQAVDRFETEARAASALRDHPNTVTVYECGDSPAGLFIAMEWLDGCTFRQRMNEGPVAIAQAVDWGWQVACALSAAHAAGILHRDIKPENIMLRKDGVVKILDFGLARLTGPLRQEPDAMGASGTISGTLSGTLLYMSPEIFRGEAASSASDIFSLGGLLYELVAGRHPFAGETNLDVYDAIECRAVAAPSRFRAGVPLEVDALILRMLGRDSTLRPSASEACAELAISRASART